MLVCFAAASCSGDPEGDIKTTLNIFMPDTSSMNVSRFRQETAPSPTVGFATAENVVPQKIPMRPQSTRLANLGPTSALEGYPPTPQ